MHGETFKQLTVSFALWQPWLFLQQESSMHSGEKRTPVCVIHRHSCAQALLIVKLEFWSPKADHSTTSQKPNAGEPCPSSLPASSSALEPGRLRHA